MRFNIFLLTLLSITLFSPSPGSALLGFFNRSHQPLTATDNKIQIPLNEINDGKAHYFSWTSADREIRFFIVKSRDNIIRAAFDACDVCYPEKKGYSQSGDFMVCNNCGQKFHSTRINVVKGGCNPAPLKRQNNGKELIISTTDLIGGAHYFRRLR